MSLAFLRAICLVLAVCLPSRAIHGAETGAVPTVMIIFDGSGSMWGKLDGERKHKLDLTRQAARSAMEAPGSNKAVAVGLASYGHRRASDCSDAEVILKPEPLDLGRLMEPLDNLNPRGRGPFTNALGQTAEALAEVKGPASIILLHDGTDNCQGDPCEFATTFAKTKPGVPVHVISIGLDKAGLEAMSCLARDTGGEHINAQTGDEITAAMASLWAKATRGGPARKGPAAAVGNGTAPQEPPAEAGFAGAGLFIRAALAGTGPVLGETLLWRVLAADKPKNAALHRISGPALALPLKPGRYVVEAKFGMVSARQTYTVAADKLLKAVLPLNAGALKLSGLPVAAVSGLDGAVVTLAMQGRAAGEKVPPGAATPLAFIKPVAQTLGIAPGRYVIEARRGDNLMRRQVEVTAGGTSDIDLAPATGSLLLRAVGDAKADPFDDVLFVVFADDPDAPSGRREIARAAGRNVRMILPAGAYTVSAEMGAARTVERLAIQSGKTVTQTIVLPVASLRLRTKLSGATAAPLSAPLSYSLSPLDRTDAAAVRTNRPAPTLILAPGRYRIESRLGLANSLMAYEVEVKAGQKGQVTIEHKAGLVRLRLTDGPGGLALGNVAWEITSPDGQPVWQSGQAEPREVLAPGRYVARAEQRGRRFERAFEVDAGDDKIVEVLLR